MVEKISRSEQKRLYKQVEQLASELADLSDADLRKLPADSEIKEEIKKCRGLKTGARKRQIKYLAKVLRQVSLDEIYIFLKNRKDSDLQKNQRFHQAERWRDVIINEALEEAEECRRQQISFEPAYPSGLIPDIIEELPGIDEKDLRRCAYEYVRTRNKTHYRELFRMIKAELDSRQRVGK
ncbi:MAG: ribosome biogenesis factor YjgA [Desulfocapsaceae bacterium]|nr:ribosome biogenesis factor YjgA [Desulfocapsaceae bacterium]